MKKAEQRKLEILEGKIEKEPEEPVKIETYHIEGEKVEIQGESVLIFDQSIDGNRLISYEDYAGEQVRRLVDDDQKQIYKIWTEPEKRQHFVNELQKRGITFAHIREVTQMYKADSFDLLLHFRLSINISY